MLLSCVDGIAGVCWDRLQQTLVALSTKEVKEWMDEVNVESGLDFRCHLTIQQDSHLENNVR